MKCSNRNTKPPTWRCSNCDTKLSDNSYYLDGEGDVCEHCYYEVGFECVLCSERFGDSLKSDYVLFKSELLNPPGIYIVLHYPFLLCPMVGTTSVFNNDVLFVDRLPQPDSHYEISGSICDNCSKPHQKTMREGYGIGRKWLGQHTFAGQTSALERNRIRQVVKRNPEMLMDLEMDPQDSEWLELKERLGLPDVRTFHDWTFFEYKGIKTYSIYTPGDSTRLSLDPRPKFRNERCMRYPVFTPSELPTWRESLYGYQHNTPVEDKEAIIIAIDKGIFQECVCPNSKD